MSGSGRKLSSNWDSRDEPEFASESVTNSNSSRFLERNDMLNSRMGFSRMEPFSGGRGSNKDDVGSEDYKVLDATNAQDTDGSYNMKTSPGFEEWKIRKHSQYSKNDYGRRSRSQSRSPSRGFRYSDVDDRNRIRAGRSTKPCRDFAVGNCRRGSHCHFLHHDNQSCEDSRESRHRQDGPRYSNPRESGDYSIADRRSNEACINFEKGRCRTGESCRFVHHGKSNGFDKVSTYESSREREVDRRHMDSSFKQEGQHYPNHKSNIPCKYFALGNCLYGKDCRFSHDRHSFTSPRLRDDRSRSNQGEDQVLDRQKMSDSVTPNERPRDDRWVSDGSMAGVDKVWDGPKQNDLVAVSDTAKLVEDKKIISAPEPGLMTWPMNDGLDYSLNQNRVHNESPFSIVSIDKKEANCRTEENAVDNILLSQSLGGAGGIWPGDEKMSPDWNYGSRSSSHIKDEDGHNKHQVARGQGLNQNAQNITASHVVGQSQATVSIVPPRARIIEGIQNQELFTEKNYIVEPNITNASLSHTSSVNTPTQNVVSKEQLAQLSCLSASLAHILGTNHQLSQLHSTLNFCDAKDTLVVNKIEGSGNPVSMTFIKPDSAIGLKQYDPIHDSMEPNNINASGVSPTFSPSMKIAKNAVVIPPLLSNPGIFFDDSCKKETNKMVAELKASSQAENKITEENSPLENMDQDDGPDEAKKTKDVKGIRAFKFSLVELTKEILKPTWKDGKITKEDYKAIVKKVTEKVTGTVPRVHIPQTQEKIERYLSVSKPKLNKLVQVSGGSLTDFICMKDSKSSLQFNLVL
ncbi:zinc finger CCCH domain-containing protein 38 isoform X1 [Trifolium pratense]|uniref:zinc finger CCCH domain-containing protein 38 isoform X1 n=1 Tax=Trifolium pratense TaxID=57577 RepID=UPI001E69507F|nr:zinc finger CCCH domain-containing protein 38 isoform X1 [Trifolium pratense]XP_045820211.1 zinc finger CCCH domain-containing protein 38 isoform X1 [Trifolium pratense]XP_045820212.1 zinc finger CCCH domain-containing protein 38 isoform X1 [Trifolium pratense]XP_045820213.1 zinc finger CCCH domain-containing protein 38 isoform X1 [Trifolium pratense]